MHLTINIRLCLLIVTLLLNRSQCNNLDSIILPTYRVFRKSLANYFRINEDPIESIKFQQNQQTIQDIYPKTTPFFCDVNGPGRRSNMPPTSVHKIRPGDIDVVGAIGDSLTAGNGIMAKDVGELINEYKGIVWCIGGEKSWREYLTIPNILKEFNPNLYGYSLGTGLSIERISKFNIAEPAALSQDMAYQAKIFYKRMKDDPKVDMANHWKLLTVFIGQNNMCSDICYLKNPESVLHQHKQDLIRMLRFLRDTIPRLIVNYVPVVSIGQLLYFKGIPPLCQAIRHIECSCFFSSRLTEERRRWYLKLLRRWQDVDKEVIDRNEFQSKEDFAVIYQPFSENATFPVLENGLTDRRYLTVDCFHFSQRGHARMANALWNNMMQKEGEKTDDWLTEFKVFECPTEERPFIATRRNSIGLV